MSLVLIITLVLRCLELLYYTVFLLTLLFASGLQRLHQDRNKRHTRSPQLSSNSPTSPDSAVSHLCRCLNAGDIWKFHEVEARANKPKA